MSRRWRRPVAAVAVAPSSLSLGRVGGGECRVEVVVVMVAGVMLMVIVMVMVVVMAAGGGGGGVAEGAEASGGGGGDSRSLGGGGGGGVALVGAARSAAAATVAAAASVMMPRTPCWWARIASLRDQSATMAERACTYDSDITTDHPQRHSGSVRLRMAAFGVVRRRRRGRGACSWCSTNHNAASRGQD